MTASSSASAPTSDRPDATALSRRALLCGAAACALAACTAIPRSLRAEGGPIVRIPLARYQELERPGGTVKVVLTEGSLFVRRAEGEAERYDALSAICTHMGCTVRPSGDGFFCACHGSRFDREGVNVGGPAPSPLERFRAVRVGDEVQVDLRVRISAVGMREAHHG